MKVLLLLAVMVAVASANISNNLVYNFKQSTQNPPENEDNSDENFLQMEMDLIERMANGKNAASSKSCCIPSKFSANMVDGVLSSAHRHKVAAVAFANASYDFYGSRVAVSEVVFTTKTKRPTTVQVWINYKKGEMYENIPMLHRCFKIRLPHVHKMPPRCLNKIKKLKHIGSASVGLAPESINLDFWGMKVRSQKANVLAEFVTSSRTCAPISEHILMKVRSRAGTVKSAVSLAYMNMKKSIPRGTFDLPAACQKGQVQELSESMLQNSGMFSQMKSMAGLMGMDFDD